MLRTLKGHLGEQVKSLQAQVGARGRVLLWQTAADPPSWQLQDGC